MALIECSECGKQISDKAASCPGCGAPQKISATVSATATAPKSRSMAVLLAMVFGSLGFHKFYLNKPGEGVLYLICCWTFVPGIIGIIDGLIYLTMSDQEFLHEYCGGPAVIQEENQDSGAEAPGKTRATLEQLRLFFAWGLFMFLSFNILMDVMEFLGADDGSAPAIFIPAALTGIITFYTYQYFKKKNAQ